MFLLSVSIVSAQDIGIEVSPLSSTVNVNERASFLVTVENGMPEWENFYIFVTGTPAHWVNIDTSYAEMPADSSRTLNLFFYPNDKPGEYEYEVFFQLKRDPSIKVSQKISISVLGEGESGEVKLVGHDISKGTDAVDIRMTLSTRTEQQVDVDYSLVSDSGVTVATDTRTYTVVGEKNISHRIPIMSDMVAGDYTAKASVKGTGIELQSSFTVDSMHRIVKSEEGTTTPLYEEVTITVSNEGNVIEKDYKVKAQVPTGFLSFSREPAECGDDWCEWVVGKLNPEESMQIIYRVEYWPLIAEGLVIAVLLAAFVFVGWSRATTPRLIKRLESRGDGGYTTVLEVKNAGRKINNVVIRDEVSPLFEVKGKFETLKPAIKQTDDGTELVWSLGAIEPKDHRIIHYGVKPVVNGHLKMPRAYMRFVAEGGKSSKVSSKETFLAA